MNISFAVKASGAGNVLDATTTTMHLMCREQDAEADESDSPYSVSPLIWLEYGVISGEHRKFSQWNSRDGKLVAYELRGEGLVWLIGAVVCLCAATRIQ